MKGTKYLSDFHGGGDYHLFRAELETEQVETDEGTLTRRVVRKFWPDSDGVNHADLKFVVAEAQELVDAFPGEEFIGTVLARGEDWLDVWRVTVNGREVRAERAGFTWSRA